VHLDLSELAMSCELSGLFFLEIDGVTRAIPQDLSLEEFLGCRRYRQLSGRAYACLAHSVDLKKKQAGQLTRHRQF
jgi:hypothetical protein